MSKDLDYLLKEKRIFEPSKNLVDKLQHKVVDGKTRYFGLR